MWNDAFIPEHTPPTLELLTLLKCSVTLCVNCIISNAGKVNMLRNCPEYYRESSLNESLAETEEFIRYIRSLQAKQVSGDRTFQFCAVI